MSKVCCASCGKEIQNGENVVRLQYGPAYYVKHFGVSGVPSKRDDVFCTNCIKSGNVAIRSNV
jgi:hypothetical protein